MRQSLILIINRKVVWLKIITFGLLVSCAHQIPSPVSSDKTIAVDYTKEVKWKNLPLEEVAFDYNQDEFFRLLEFILPKDQNSNYELIEIRILEDSVSLGTYSGSENPILFVTTLGLAPMYSYHTLGGQVFIQRKTGGGVLKVPFKISRKYGEGIYYFFKGLFQSDWALGKLPEKYREYNKHSLRTYMRERITETILSSYELDYQESVSCRTNSDCTVTSGPCGGARAINNLNRVKYEFDMIKIKKNITCEQLLPAGKQMEGLSSFCEKSICKLK